MKLFNLAATLLVASASAAEKFNEIKILDGHTVKSHVESPLPHTYLSATALPPSFTWGNVDGEGTSYLTHNLNQHLPQYCGSCWAHGSLSALADRIKIARKGRGNDINLSIQYILNCGAETAGSCHGGYHTGVYQLIQDMGYVPYDTCQPYIACSAESTEGFCQHVDTTCKKENICKTCDTFGGMGGKCTPIDYFPNATVAEYGMVNQDVDEIMMEIYTRGPVAATINAEPIVDYTGGIFTDTQYSQETNHIVSIVGWGTDEETGIKYWIIRNSWGEYYGELGFLRVEMGKNLLGIEGEVAWATPGSWTEVNYPCAENGENCHSDDVGYGKTDGAMFYVDPSKDVQAVQRRLQAHN
ncbi:cysteine proteinase [Chaetoceros tenuissimus]|uniref:Cysteine proteinase n=1 Tax=Chaetoceros tenuissimus TaxID=426638 RepID=A0AAD3HBR1_9STRA|nr:cysteine proteinase [Chaetoceros tenuissimus]